VIRDTLVGKEELFTLFEIVDRLEEVLLLRYIKLVEIFNTIISIDLLKINGPPKGKNTYFRDCLYYLLEIGANAGRILRPSLLM